jgi:hypothetical protein
MTVSSEYLETAVEAGLLYSQGGITVVADVVADAMTRRSQCLVEYVTAPGLDDPSDFPQALHTFLRDRWPECSEAVVRTSTPVGPPFTPYLTYVTLPPDSRTGHPPADTDLVRDQQLQDEDTISSMLAEALVGATLDRGQEADQSAVAEAVESVLRTPERVTFIAERAGSVVGHATLLPGITDDPTGAQYIELLDVLVRPFEDRAAFRQLVAAAEAYAAVREVPLLGNVVHSVADPQHADRTLATLQRSGWRITHHYSMASLS